ncbi:unnamed protein product (macronuclear) [Paramecium tetraurelia]|uniref:G domain-containing protein n=1 Tax=Paramecium tetraurelia TaxID=5888 RepID=A0CEG6_PARTE|nr:uncharacterized protein GSPATT00037620001 [Paramecium tetraurelia]CAK69183.1 unnamed protein product [Paramecium tetraurelia]|eukprot:XP_001436580.1 hypothetical protein (macronuclear) [Paramecium tetraurelia strain d4-2]
MSALRVVLLGVLGHGKTYLFNKITNANEAVIYGGKSVTKQIVIGQAAHGEFEVVDTPGFDASEDKLLHAAGVIAALAQGDVNRILIVVKCERTDIMIKNIKKVIGSIQRYKDLITIVVTYWDEQQRNIRHRYKSQESQQQQELEAKYQIETAIKNNFNISSVIISSFEDDPIIITEKITKIILLSRFTKIHLQESEIYSQFDLISVSEESEMEFNKSISQIRSSFRKISKLFLMYIETQQLNENYLIDKLHYLSLSIKSIANEFIEKFERQYGDYMNETYDTDGINVRYLHHIYLKKELRLDLEQVIKKAQSKMKESQIHCFNWIKQCPYCGLVWIKVVGCDNETTCGNRVDSYFDDLLVRTQNEKRFKIIVNNDSVDIEILDEQKSEKKLVIQQDLNIYQILFNSIKDNPVLSKNFKIYYSFFNSDSDSDLEQLKVELVISILGLQRVDYYIKNIYEVDQEMMINEFKFLLRESGWFQSDFPNLNFYKQKSLGCGNVIVWKDLAPLSGPLLQELLSPELLDYFNDQEQLLKDEADDIAKELERTYKNLMNQAITEQLKNIKVIPKLLNIMETLDDTVKQKQEQYNQNLQQNFQNHIEKTKIEQQNVKRRYSIKMSIDDNFNSDTENADSSRIEVPKDNH